ncbi:hypothetical protein SISSUDRAFT_971978, partial [Sistotremastrum suecicum HHB10207 ss-3]
SFKRKLPSSTTSYPGTRPCPSAPSILISSSGIPSLDDVLGGGIPLSHSLLVLSPDSYSAYASLVHKYFIAQGLINSHQVCVVDPHAKQLVDSCMWVRGTLGPSSSIADDEQEADRGDKIKIAWRYESMRQFETTVSHSQAEEEYCRPFELTQQIPPHIVDKVSESGQLSLIWYHSTQGISRLQSILQRIDDVLSRTRAEHSKATTVPPVRISIPSLASPHWGDLDPSTILRFLQSLKRLLRQYSFACAMISLPAHLSRDSVEEGWIRKLAWLSDSCVSFAAFSGDPSLEDLFPRHHGLFHIHRLPTPHSLVPPSDRFSQLRGIANSANGGGGENNLAFKSTRKRLVIETLHLDVDGGISERRT